MVEKINIAQILEAPNAEYLFKLYFKEGSRDILSTYEIDKKLFYTMDANKMLDCFGIFEGDTLVGFTIASTSRVPHYSCEATTIVSLFILKEFRKHGRAKSLIESVEKVAKFRGSKMVLLSAPVKSTLMRYAPLLGYKETNVIYGKAL